MSFKFRFAAIMQLRRRERDEAAAAVGKADEAVRRIAEQTREIESERVALREKAAEARADRVSVDAVLSHGRYDIQLQSQIQSLRETRTQLVTELERRQMMLTAADAELKRFERLEERERERYHQEQRRQEQAEADDASGRQYIIKQRIS